MTQFERELEERLVRYAVIDTQSDETSPTSPSTESQFDLLEVLEDELRDIGATDVRITEYGVVLATLPATAPGDLPVMGWLAHVDTAPGFAASGVKPVVHRGYDGGAISFADAPDLVVSPEQSPYLGQRIGDDIITASGTTLLGADDKAGIAIIMTAARHLLANPSIPRGPIRIAFTPDEEIGRGVDARLPDDLGVDFAFTLDGAERGGIVHETFSADGAAVRITGGPIHPGAPATDHDPRDDGGSTGLHASLPDEGDGRGHAGVSGSGGTGDASRQGWETDLTQIAPRRPVA